VSPRATIGRPEWVSTVGVGARHRPVRDAAAIRHHYDVGNEFYQLWLDARQVYSCAYFHHADVSLDAAQWAKLDLVCRKLRLLPGERLLDVGCGWGALIHHAVENYGVTAVGITLSPAQAVAARQRIRQAGMDDRCHVELLDYRDVGALGAFDKIASVGMVEHVGSAQLQAYFDALFRVLRPGGLLLNHGIVSLHGARPASAAARLRRRMWRSGAFIDRYIFPDGELVTLGESTMHAEAAGFEVRDVEGLRPHYTLTLRQWLARLDARRDEAIKLVGAERFRAWRLYLAGSAQAFDSGWLGVAQILASRSATDGGSALPLTRHDLYCQP
jgi:cyclopropane-fatty-acyl-phospholipid synthase